MSGTERPKVLFIAGWQRSGTTLLGNMLASSGGAAHVGELEHLVGHAAGSYCGCGQTIQSCLFWRKVVESDFPFAEWRAVRVATARSKYLPANYWQFRAHGDIPRYAEMQADLYRRIRAACSLPIIDSSKRPSAAFAGATSREIDFYLLHVVRDPRAVSYSAAHRVKRHGVDGEGLPMLCRSVRDTSLKWLVTNGAIERFVRPVVPDSHYFRVRYEDLVSRPATFMEEIAAWAGLEQQRSPFLDANTLSMSTAHTAMGNPIRFQSGDIKVLPDTAWQRKLSTKEKRTSTAITLPLLLRYGYAVNV